jgi:hypothetical protein
MEYNKGYKKTLNDISLMISNADKGKTFVILPTETHKTNIQDFQQNNQLTKLNTNPTDQHQKITIQELTKQSNIQKKHKLKYKTMNPIAPNLHATIKLHTQNTPIRPGVNWKYSPAYNITQFVAKILEEILNLPHTFNVKHLVQLINNMNNISISENTRICSFHMKDTYKNPPTRCSTHNP